MDNYDSTQAQLMKEELILVDHQDKPVGSISKKEGHLRSYLDSEKSTPHRAFSAFLFNDKNELLLQRRSDKKITFPNMWTNTCCSHPLYNKDELKEGPIPFQGIKTAAVRRMAYELNMKNLTEKDFNMVLKILYKANTDKTWAEYELDYILFAKKPMNEIQFDSNVNEISHTEFVSKEKILDFLESEIKTGKSEVTPWFNLILQTRLFDWWGEIERTGKIPAEDASGEIINFYEGKDKMDPASLPPITEVKQKIMDSFRKRKFSSLINRKGAQNSVLQNTASVDFTKSYSNTVSRDSMKNKKEIQREQKQNEEFYEQMVKDQNDTCADQFGEKDLLRINKSQYVQVTPVSELNETMAGKNVTLRGRVHNIRAKGR